MRKITGIIGLLVFLSISADAQLLKKLGERAEKAAERTILNRTDKEVSKGTDKAIDGVLKGDKKKKKAESQAEEEPAKKQSILPSFLGGNLDDVPDAYTFSYRATMKIISDKDEMDMLYWLEPEAPYFGSQLLNDNGNQITVMDMENQGMVVFMDNGKQKMAMRMKGNQQLIEKYIQQAADEESADEMQLEAIGSKEILGYTCKGYQVETADGIAKIWVTDEAPVESIAGLLDAKHMPDGAIPFGSEALFMEMEYIPKKKKKDQFRMECTELKAVALTIKKADYQSMEL